MIDISFCITADDYEKAHAALDGADSAEKKIWILPGRKAWKGSEIFTVVDNRDTPVASEDFNTLDGALIYALGIRSSAEDSEDWDYMGALADGLDDDGFVVQETYGYCPKCNMAVENDHGKCPKCGRDITFIRPVGEKLPPEIREMIAKGRESDVIEVKKGKMKDIPLGDTEQRLQKLEAKIGEIYERHGWL